MLATLYFYEVGLVLGVVVVAQLVKQSLPTPEIRVSNPVIGKFIYYQLFKSSCFEKKKIKKKSGREMPIHKNRRGCDRYVSTTFPSLYGI